MKCGRERSCVVADRLRASVGAVGEEKEERMNVLKYPGNAGSGAPDFRPHVPRSEGG